MLREDGNFIFLQIEAYCPTTDLWTSIEDRYYLKRYELGEHSACGKCWQEIGEHGIYDLEYAKRFCNDLNKSLTNGEMKYAVNNPTKFRLVSCKVSQERIPMEPSMY